LPGRRRRPPTGDIPWTPFSENEVEGDPQGFSAQGLEELENPVRSNIGHFEFESNYSFLYNNFRRNL
jgi:hypothetical protein